MPRLALEVIATSVADAVAAEQGGADRLELVVDLSRGGMTPPAALVDEILGRVRIPIRVMVRETDRTRSRTLTADRLVAAADGSRRVPWAGSCSARSVTAAWTSTSLRESSGRRPAVRSRSIGPLKRCTIRPRTR
jgi:hypothetical protein